MAKFVYDKLVLRRIAQHERLQTKYLWTNPHITHDRVDALSTLFPIDYQSLSENPKINIALVLDNLDKPWSWGNLSRNPSILLDDVLKNVRLPWNWFWVSYKDGCTLALVAAHPGLPWDWGGISKSVSFRDFNEHPELPWNFASLSYNSNIPLQYYIDNPDRPWEFHGIGVNRSRSFESIEDHIHDIHWSWYAVSCNPNVVFSEHVIGNPMYPWHPFAISGHKNTRIVDIEGFPEFPWDWQGISGNPNVNVAFVSRHLDKDWDWERLSTNPGIDFKAVVENPQLPWNWRAFARNPNALEIDHDEYNDYVEMHIAANRIKRRFRKAMSDPRYILCRKRLYNELHSLNLELLSLNFIP
jgi:hypothetical protein